MSEPKSFHRAALATLAGSVVLLFALSLGGGPGNWRAWLAGRPVGLEAALRDEDLKDAARLHQAFASLGYGLDAIRQGVAAVPPVFLPAMPDGLDALPVIEDKKSLFLRLMLPLVLEANRAIAEDRARLTALAARPVAQWSADEMEWAATLAARYGLEQPTPRELLRRVDVVPPSLALAQAIEESGWGTSRYVREANNLFGHITTGTDGMAPQGDGAAGPSMAVFGSLYDSVSAYIHNLNTHGAYKRLRQVRSTFRAKGAAPDGYALAGSLHAYSERGQAYVDTIRTLITSNHLHAFDKVRLRRS